ncbi:FUSC family protein [Schumannella sp. 10F1B-5-1]|uniref:FUSC family protein n=1 Tax=Schumannella sp. 10F1B-5-1 TaxID=2590780 RepID=UPI00112FED52|nr:FUSC family protein [Schumannella sp. 10F1B-5-1]TPW70215.1 FUSC family protein [Schumannella sp. 10F1B-5-1]
MASPMTQDEAPRIRPRTALARLAQLLVTRDIGLTRTLAGLRALVCSGAGMLVGWLLGMALGLPPVVGVMLGALPAFLSCLVVSDARARTEAWRTALMFVPFVVALFLSLELHRYRVVELVLVVVLLAGQLLAQGRGGWVADAGVGAFAAFISGLLLPLPATDFIELAALFAASLATTIVLRLLFFRPDAARSLQRTRAAVGVLVDQVVGGTVELLLASAATRPRRERTLRRRIDRLQVAALLADGLISEGGPGVRGTLAHALHRALFDVELAVETIADAAGRLPAAPADDDAAADGPSPADRASAVLRGRVAAALDGAGAGPSAVVAADRLAALREDGSAAIAGDAAARELRRLELALRNLARAVDEWRTTQRDLDPEGTAIPFESAVSVINGRISGPGDLTDSVVADATARGFWRRLRLTAAGRTAVQGLIAVAIAEPIAVVIDQITGGNRFYWAVIGVVVVLSGTTTTRERLRKTWSRIWGTAAGGLIGIPLAALTATAHPAWTVAIVLLCLGLGVFFISSAYPGWVIALVVLLCQLYSATQQLTPETIPLRLVENGLGALVAVGVSAIVLPLGTTSLVRRAVRELLEGVGGFSAALRAGESDLRTSARAVDQALFRVEAVLGPVPRFAAGRGDRRDGRLRLLVDAIAITVARLAAQTAPPEAPSGADRRRTGEALDELDERVDALQTSLDAAGHRGAPPTPSAASAASTGGEQDRSPEPDTVTGLLKLVVRESPLEADSPWTRARLELIARLDAGVAAVGRELVESPGAARR